MTPTDVMFTGSRYGMTGMQIKTLITKLIELREQLNGATLTFHHGSCVGADFQCHLFVRGLFGAQADIWLHPAKHSWLGANNLRARCERYARDGVISHVLEP